jgi:hypothetical protein
VTNTDTPRVLLETSEVLRYVLAERGHEAVDQLLWWVETGRIQVAVTRAAFDELTGPLADAARATRMKRLLYVAQRQENVFRIGSGRVGVEVVGHADSDLIERGLPERMSLADRDQFLSFVSGKYTYLATADSAFTQSQTRERVLDKYDLNVGSSAECVTHLHRQIGLPLRKADG